MASHGHGGPKTVMCHPDGRPYTKAEVIIFRRGAFRWLPVLCSNDLVHGSWWMVWGSLGCALFAVVPLIQQYLVFYSQHDDLLPSVDFDLTWALLIFSGFFFTLGSLAFVRAFEEPPKRALFYWYKHLQSDELLGAWLFLLGTVPSVPYTLVFFLIKPSFTYLGALSSSGVFVVGTVLFVMACYPSDVHHKDRMHVLCFRYCTFWPPWMCPGCNAFIVKHLANDWLAGTWFFFWANLMVTIGSFFFLFGAVATGNEEQIFIWLSSAANSFLFLVGSMYFVSGSYPHATQFYYKEGLNKDAEAEVTAAQSRNRSATFSNAIDVESGRGNGRPEINSMERVGKSTLNPLHNNAETAAKSGDEKCKLPTIDEKKKHDPKDGKKESKDSKGLSKSSSFTAEANDMQQTIVQQRLEALLGHDDEVHEEFDDDDDDHTHTIKSPFHQQQHKYQNIPPSHTK